MDQTFAVERPLAQHCAELTRRSPQPAERAEHLAAWCRDVSNDLGTELSQLFSGEKLKADLAHPEMMSGHAVFDRIGPIAANSLLRCGDGDQTMLMSIDYSTALALTDCSFGGDGAISETVPATLPRSAGMLVEQVAKTVAQVLALVNGSGDARGDVLVRSESVTRLKPFEAEAEAACLTLTLGRDGSSQWIILLAIASDRLDSLLPGTTAQAPGHGAATGDAAGMPQVFADIPLPLQVVLGEFDVSLDRLDRLCAGDEIPLAIANNLPLRMGGTVLAHGSIGTLENRMALRLTQSLAAGAAVPHAHFTPVSTGAAA